jgi:hypothetical protein
MNSIKTKFQNISEMLSQLLTEKELDLYLLLLEDIKSTNLSMDTSELLEIKLNYLNDLISLKLYQPLNNLNESLFLAINDITEQIAKCTTKEMVQLQFTKYNNLQTQIFFINNILEDIN